MKYMLDTNICIALIRHKSPALLQKLITHQPGEVGISSITLSELTYGVEKSALREQNLTALQQFLLPLELVEFDDRAAFVYGKVRAELERSGQPIGSMDMLIAAHALSVAAILVTNNGREFQHVEGLIIEDWLKS
jgi:tRNA(fMet)-specific endonuclease VapC